MRWSPPIASYRRCFGHRARNEAYLFWITSRAAGGAALLLASASVAVGLMMSSKRPDANKRDLRAIHEALSLATLAMVALHGLALLGDSYLNPGPAGIAIPFIGFYRPLGPPSASSPATAWRLSDSPTTSATGSAPRGGVACID
jgi:hypothetical protein